jgi:hypothetical protein
MRKQLKIVLLIIGLLQLSNLLAKENDVYIVFYATYKGKTGHVGIAIDNYAVFVNDAGDKKDTIATKELTYYDLWPDEDFFRVGNTGKNLPAAYYKLPMHSGDEITVNTLYYKGLPHKEHYPSDGILKIKTTWKQDKELTRFIEAKIEAGKSFNARKYNCTDFVKEAAEFLLNKKISCNEFVGVGWSSTPNYFYRSLRRLNTVVVIKNADRVTKGSFLSQRVFYKIFHKRKV